MMRRGPLDIFPHRYFAVWVSLSIDMEMAKTLQLAVVASIWAKTLEHRYGLRPFS
jgi:hypothetical protein